MHIYNNKNVYYLASQNLVLFFQQFLLFWKINMFINRQQPIKFLNLTSDSGIKRFASFPKRLLDALWTSLK